MQGLNTLWERIRDFWGRNRLPILVVFIAVAILLVATALVISGHLQTGFSGKTLWNWIEVLAVPLGAALIIGLLTSTAHRTGQRVETERELSIERARESALREYLDRISGLILEWRLRECDTDAPVRALAQAWTAGAFTVLDPRRKGVIVRFLHDSKLITTGEAIISLALADLTRSDLSGANLTRVDLTSTNLRFADLYDADLSGADLYRSVVGGKQLAEAKSAIGARMPDGTIMTQELWEQFKEKPWDFPRRLDKFLGIRI